MPCLKTLQGRRYYVIQHTERSFDLANTFYGGIQLKRCLKYNISSEHDIIKMEPPLYLSLPLSAKGMKTAKPLVKIGDEVTIGQLIASSSLLTDAENDKRDELRIFSPVSGTVTGFCKKTLPDRSVAECITIKNDLKFKRSDLISPVTEPISKLSARDILRRIKAAGIPMNSSSAFPSYSELFPSDSGASGIGSMGSIDAIGNMGNAGNMGDTGSISGSSSGMSSMSNRIGYTNSNTGNMGSSIGNMGGNVNGTSGSAGGIGDIVGSRGNISGIGNASSTHSSHGDSVVGSGSARSCSIIKQLIIDCTECEPYVYSNHAAIVAEPKYVVGGIKILMSLLGVRNAILAVTSEGSDHYDVYAKLRSLPEARSPFSAKIMPHRKNLFSVTRLRAKYPLSNERLMIYSIAAKELGKNMSPVENGYMVVNAGICRAIYLAFAAGMPYTERIVTVSGNSIKKGAELIAPLGASVSDLISACGGFTKAPEKIVCSGLLGGDAINDTDIPITHTTSSIIVLSKDRSKEKTARNAKSNPLHSCIDCGKCIRSCPMHLMPYMIAKYASEQKYSECLKYSIDDCIDCGCCDFICPSRIPLSRYINSALQKDERARKAKAQPNASSHKKASHLKNAEAANAVALTKTAKEKESNINSKEEAKELEMISEVYGIASDNGSSKDKEKGALSGGRDKK